MRAVGTITWSMLRRAAGGFAFVALILGLGLAFSTTAFAGARRSDSAYTRLRAASLAPDVVVGADGLDRDAMAHLTRMRSVTGAARFTYTPVAPAPLRPGMDAGAFVGLDPDFLRKVYRPFVVSGRLARPGDPTEVVVNETLARAGRFVPGRRVRLTAGFDHARSIGRVTVVGIVRGVFDVGVNAGNGSMYLGVDFLDAHRDALQLGPQPAALIRLRDPVGDLPALQRTLEDAVGHPVVTLATSADSETVERFLNVQTIGLLVLAATAFVAVLAAALQALSRQFDRAFADLPVLVAFGLRPRQRYAIAACLAGIVAALGGAIGVLGSILASPLVPTGFARNVDPMTGVHLDGFAAALVVVAASSVLIGLATITARRHRVTLTASSGRTYETRIARKLPLLSRLGIEGALAPARAPAGAAARAALAATTVAVAGILAVGVFATSLDHLLDEPRLQGWSFDAAISRQGDARTALERELTGIDAEPGIASHGVATIVEIERGGSRFEAYAFDSHSFAMQPTMRSGRPLRADDEMVAGEDALTSTGLTVGDTVVVRGANGHARLRIVGSATYPELGNNSDLASGISITQATATRLGAPTTGTVGLVRFEGRGGLQTLATHRGDGEVVAAFRPPRVRTLEYVGSMPAVLAAFLGALGLLAVVHALRRSSRERRHDFALLATLGVTRSGRRAIVAWQSLAIASVALALGIPTGLLIGRAAWSAVADATGVVDALAVPSPWILLLAAVTVLVCVGFGLIAARPAIRPRPAVALRSD